MGSPWKLYLTAYADAITNDNVTYIPELEIKGFFKIIYRVHLSKKINSIIKLPWKNIWNAVFFRKFKKEEPIYFLLFSDWYCQNTGIIKYIRTNYKNAKIAVFFQDLIATKKMNYTELPVNIDKLKAEVDLVLTFDFGDAKRYKIVYHPIPYSTPLDPVIIEDETIDVYFLGQAKNRLEEILATYYKLKSLGTKLNFILSNVPKEQQKQLDGVTYTDGVTVSYDDNIKYVKSSRCILELMQKSGTGYTSRTLEALSYDKRLMTNNAKILDAPFYNSEYILYFKDISEINSDFLQKIRSTQKPNYSYADQLSPVKLLEFIERKLQ